MNFDKKYLTNPPYFDFVDAEENYGFDFESFQEQSFTSFLQDFISDYIKLRIAYIARDMNNVRNLTHKFKGIFR